MVACITAKLLQGLLSGQIPLLFSTSGNDVLKRIFSTFLAEKLVPKDSKDFDSREFGAFAHTDINITLTITVYCTDHCSVFTIHL